MWAGVATGGGGGDSSMIWCGSVQCFSLLFVFERVHLRKSRVRPAEKGGWKGFIQAVEFFISMEGRSAFGGLGEPKLKAGEKDVPADWTDSAKCACGFEQRSRWCSIHNGGWAERGDSGSPDGCTLEKMLR